MFISTLLIAVTIIVIVSFNLKNKYTSILFFYMSSISYIIFVAAIYVSKISHYSFPLRIDYLIYLKLSGIKIATMNLSRIYNWGIALFLLSSLYCAKIMQNFSKRKFILLSLPILFFCIYSDPITARRIWVYQYYNFSANFSVFNEINSFFRMFSQSLIIAYTLLPFFSILDFYKKTKFVVKKFHTKIFTLCIFLIDAFFYLIFISGPFKMIMHYNVNPMGLPNIKNTLNGYIIIPCLTFVIVLIIVILLMVIKPFNMFYFEYNKKRDIVKNTQMLTKNISVDLHLYKNMFWSAKQQFELIKLAVKNADYESIYNYADSGINDMSQQISRLQDSINAMSNDFPLIEHIDICKCVDNAISKIKNSKNVRIIKDYTAKSIMTAGNEYVLTEVFLNLIKNSYESFENANVKDPTILIRTQVEDNICMIEINDNGCGIANNDLKNIFNPFYSTKIRTKNSGIGLNYVKEVIKSYHGTIEVISKVNQYTTFQLTLPISKRKENTDE